MPASRSCMRQAEKATRRGGDEAIRNNISKLVRVVVTCVLVPGTGMRDARTLSPRGQSSACLPSSFGLTTVHNVLLCKLSVLPVSFGGKDNHNGDWAARVMTVYNQ